LLSLSKQTHPRIGVLGIDNASSDRSGDLLRSALGAERVVRMEHNVGFAGAVRAGMVSSLAGQADYLLLLHDDTVLQPDAVAALVEAAEHVDDAGVVGPKVVDWDSPLELLEIGQSTDRFGLSLFAPRGGGDRPGTVRPHPRGPVRVLVRHARLPGRAGSRGRA
jgi:GT2 family glycosyltransferase